MIKPNSIPTQKVLPSIGGKPKNDMDDLDDLLDDIQPIKKPVVKNNAKNDPWGDANTVTSNKQNTEDQFFEGGEDDEDPWSGIAQNNNKQASN